jgi:hypothetical protein
MLDINALDTCFEKKNLQHKPRALQAQEWITIILGLAAGSHHPTNLIQNLTVCHFAVLRRLIALPQEANLFPPTFLQPTTPSRLSTVTQDPQEYRRY